MAAPKRNGKHIFNQHPKDFPIPGTTTLYDNSTEIDLEQVPLEGGILGQLIVLSIDPYLRGRMNPKSGAPFALGEPLVGYGVIKVIRSEHPKFSAGDYIYDRKGGIKHEEYTILSAKQADSGSLTVIKRYKDLPLSVYVGAAGMPGMTAWTGWKEYAKAKKGETVFISTAAGAVGSMLVQIAKHEGLKVIGSAGSDKKVDFVKQLGADVVFNYKTTNTREVLAKEGPIDIYWDNVGGDILDAALENMNSLGRVIICGSISGYNGEPVPVKNLMLTIYKQISINGLLVGALAPKYQDSFNKEVVPKLADGTWKYNEHKKYGLDKAPEAILDVQKGKNTGKSVIVVHDE
jgi:NADPH-dependent curcumin reductase CurA